MITSYRLIADDLDAPEPPGARAAVDYWMRTTLPESILSAKVHLAPPKRPIRKGGAS